MLLRVLDRAGRERTKRVGVCGRCCLVLVQSVQALWGGGPGVAGLRHESALFQDGGDKLCRHQRKDTPTWVSLGVWHTGAHRVSRGLAGNVGVPAQKKELPSVRRGNTMERAIPMLENGLPTRDRA